MDPIPYKILLIDDDEDDYILTREMLSQARHGHELVWEKCFEKGRQALHSQSFDVILVDYDLGQGTGLELIREMTARQYPSPMILLTGRGSSAVDLEAMEAGATLYLTKSEVNPLLLERSIRYAVEHKRIQQSLQTRQVELEQVNQALREANEMLELQKEELSHAQYLTEWQARFPEENPNPIARVSLEGDFLYRNQAAARILSWENHRESRAPVEIQALVSDAIHQGDGVNRQLQWDGRWYSVWVIPFPLEGYANIYTEDITQRKLAEQHLRERAEEMEKLMNLVPVAVWVSNDPNCLEITGNQVANQTYEAMEGENVSAGSQPNRTTGPRRFFREGRELSAAELPMQEAAAKNCPVNNSIFDVLLTSGHRRTLWGSAVPLQDSEGNARGAIAAFMDITVQKRIEQDLRAANQRLAYQAALVENVSSAILSTDSQGLIKTWNKQSEHLTGWTAEDALGQNLIRLVNPLFPTISTSSRSQVFDDLHRIGSWSGEVSFTHQDGSTIIVLASAAEIRDTSGDIDGYIVSATDITKRKRLEVDLMASEEKYRELVRLAPAAIYQIDFLTEKFTSVNDTMCELTGYSRVELLQINPFGILVDEDKIVSKERIQAWLSGNQPDQSVEFTIIAKNGHHLQVVLNATFFRDENGVPRGSTVIAFDITARKQAVNALKRQNAIQKGINRIFEQAITCETERELGNICLKVVEEVTGSQFGFICELDTQTNQLMEISDSNPGWVECQMDDPIGHCKQPPNGLPNKGIHARVLKQGKGFYTNDLASEPDRIGTPRRFPSLESFLGVPLNMSGKTDGMICLANRPGGYGQAELEAVEALAPVIQQAFLSKRADACIKAYSDQLERSNHDLMEFAYAASHDLQEPLRKIEAFSDRLRARIGNQLGGIEQEYLERMQNAANRMRRMIDDLLQLSKVSTSGTSLQEVDLNPIVHTVLDDLEIHMLKSGGEVQTGILPIVQGDPLQMHQLFQNLIGNALKFHRAGVPSQVILSCKQSANGDVEILVEDNGIGFDMAYADQLFKPFTRLVGSSAYEGSGMGLAICQKIVTRHGGKISAKGTPGLGAQFTVTLHGKLPA